MVRPGGCAVQRAPTQVVEVPLGYPTSTIYIDESGSKASAGRFFVVAAVKVREHGQFARAAQDVRDKTGFRGEFKFSDITHGALPAYYALADVLEETSVHVAACIVDRQVHDPFTKDRPLWQVHADVTSQLLVGCLNKRELASVLLDSLSTPRGIALEDEVRRRVNHRLGSTVVVTAACLNSRSSDGLQVADLVASAIGFERRRLAGTAGKPNSNKGKVANRLKAALGGVELVDGRCSRVNIATYRTPKTVRKTRLKAVSTPRAS